MALLGGGVGGAGNPVGGSFTGPAEALEIIGDHAYAYSGQLAASTTDVLHLSFTSGNYYFVGTMSCLGQTLANNTPSGGISNFRLALNGTIVMAVKTDTKEEDSPSNAVIPVIIPPYTVVTVNVESGDDTSFSTNANLTGRIYRTRD